MARVRVSVGIANDLIFGFAGSPVRISDARFDHDHQVIVFEITGDDVPDAPEVRAVCTDQVNGARQHFTTMIFEPVESSR